MQGNDGDKYVGEWKNGSQNGHGTITYSNGNMYVGKWKEGKRNGQGTQYDKDGNIIWKFVNGRRVYY